MEMMKGIVKWFSAKDGYGFIETQEGKDVFVHYSAIKVEGYKTINKGDEVQFEVVQGNKGLQAQNVVVTKPAEHEKSDSKGKQESTQ